MNDAREKRMRERGCLAYDHNELTVLQLVIWIGLDLGDERVRRRISGKST